MINNQFLFVHGKCDRQERDDGRRVSNALLVVGHHGSLMTFWMSDLDGGGGEILDDGD